MKEAMKIAIGKRFAESVDYLISEKFAGSKAEIAAKLGTKPTNLSEILNFRQGPQLDHLALLFSEYSINPSFIFLNEMPIRRGSAVVSGTKSIQKTQKNTLSTDMVVTEAEVGYRRQQLQGIDVEGMLSALGPLGEFLRTLEHNVDALMAKK